MKLITRLGEWLIYRIGCCMGGHGWAIVHGPNKVCNRCHRVLEWGRQ